MTADPIITEVEAALRGGSPSDSETCCRVCGLDINPIFGVDAHYDCSSRESQRQPTPVLATVTDISDTASSAIRFVDHAVAYARAGLSVLPLHPRAKTPATRHGKDDATTDVERITAWWARHPDHNIGIRPPKGTVVLDVDPRNGGDDALAELVGRHEPLPETWTCRTGSGGRHIWLRAPGPFRGQLCDGVDLKSNTGYLVVPPSIHPNGQRYRWANTAPVAHAPAWLRPMLAPPPPPPRRPAAPSSSPGSYSSRGDLVNFVASAAEGNRNRALFWAASRAAAEGTLTELGAQLVAAAVNNGLTDLEAQATLKSVHKRTANS